MLPDYKTLNFAVNHLGGENLTPEQVKGIEEAYSGRGRFYHAVIHASTMAIGMSGDVEIALRGVHGVKGLPQPTPESISDHAERLMTVAGVYHDIVYEPEDGGPKPYIASILSHYIDTVQEGDKTIYKIKSTLPENKSLQAVLDIFNFKPGDTLDRFKGQNEFMSAVVMMHELERAKVSPAVIAEIAMIIEGTIPFLGQDHFQILERRLSEANAKYNLGLTEDHIKRAGIAAVHLCNRDVEGFAKKDFGDFITDTMKLIPESKPQLREGKYKPIDYVNSLKGPLFFFEKLLNPDNIYHQIHSYPSDTDFQALTTTAKANVEVGKVYLKSKFVSASVAAAIASVIDEPDVALPELMSRAAIPITPVDEATLTGTKAQTVLAALEGRGQGDIGKFDIDGSPIGRLMFGALGEGTMMQLYDKVKDMDITKKDQAAAYLKLVKQELGAENFAKITEGLALVAEDHKPARADALRALSAQLYIGAPGVGAARAGGGGS